MAMDMMKNMNPDDMQNMMKTVQQNPQMYQQAMNMMQGGNMPRPPATPPTGPPVQNPNFGAPGGNSFPELAPIAGLKEEGNRLFKAGKFEEAGSKYLYAILDVEGLRTRLRNDQTSNPQFLKELNDLEVSSRNNYCSVKIKLEEFDLLIRHAERILEVDERNAKARFNLAQAFFALKDLEKAKFYIKDVAKGVSEPAVLALQAKIDEQLNPKAKQTPTTEPEKPPTSTADKKEQVVKEPEPALNRPSTSNDPADFESNEWLPSPEPTSQPNPPTNPEPENKKPEFTEFQTGNDDFDIKEENSFEDIEKYFQNDNHESKPKQSDFSSKQAKDAETRSVPSGATEPGLTQKAPPSGSGSAFDRYWQILLGILIGLILAKLLKF